MNYTDDECVRAIRKAADKFEGEVTIPKYRQSDIEPSVRTLIRRFGSWNDAKELAGLEPIPEGQNQVVEPPSFDLNKEGYMEWRHNDGDVRRHVLVHRLTAVAKYGFDEVAGMVVHHKNNIPWDNRPENLEVMGRAEHARYHRQQQTASES